jgi:hypothetical protein
MRVYFTIDTESSIGGAWRHPDRRPVPAARHVFCRIGEEDFGIPLLTRMLAEHGFHGTFFVETLATRCLGEADSRSIFDFLLAANQDVQLHIHPVFYFYDEAQKSRRVDASVFTSGTMDFIGQFSPQVQLDLLGEAVTFFERFAGYRPSAFRAGCFAGSRAMLRTLHSLGIRIDSSFNPCYPQLSFPGETLCANLVTKIDDVWEFPVTVARTLLPEGHGGFKFADCTSLSFHEMRTMLDTASESGLQHFVIVFHSFSAVKARDETYSALRPNRIVIRRLQKLFKYLADQSARFTVDTFGDVARRTEMLDQEAQSSMVPVLPVMRSLARKTVQALNNYYWL